MTLLEKKRQLKTILLLAFLYGFAVALSLYVISSFLTDVHGIAKSSVGLIFTISSALAIVILSLADRFYERFGNKKSLVRIMIVTLVAAVTIILAKVAWLAALAVIVMLAVFLAEFFVVDLNLEHYSRNSDTGKIRGIYYTLLGATWVLAPLISASVLGAGLPYNLVFGLVFLCVLASLFITVFKLKEFPVKQKKKFRFWRSLLKYFKKKPLRQIFVVSFAMQMFFSMMTIYVPLFLIGEMGISWAEMSYIFPIMFLPLILLESPIGKLADKKYGEKEFMLVGLVIMIVSLLLLAFSGSRFWWVYALILFLSRVGVSGVEVTSESYFFKHISEKDDMYVGIYRESAPLGYLVGPMLASLFLGIFGMPLNYVFILAVGLLALAFINTLFIKDTK